MSLGKVQVNNLNLGQGDIQGVERHFLFVGRAGSADEESQLFSVGAQTVLADTFADSPLLEIVKAAQLNAGQNWTAAVYPLAEGESITDAIDRANEVQSFEMVVVCDEQTTSAGLTDIHDHLTSLQATLGRFVSALVAVPGIDVATQTWSQYEAATIALQSDIAAHLVVPVPQLHANNVGVLAGRLCNRSVSIADSPMRVATGSVLGLGEAPVDTNDDPLSLATLETLANARMSVPQWYSDFEGTYWSDAQTLDAAGGDYQYLEHLRPVHKASRELRVLAIRRIANRALNSTPNSIELNKAYFMRPLRAMSKSTTILGTQFPGEIQPPVEGDINIVWTSNKSVVIYMVLRPYNSPKEITVNILLDLSSN
ncbi:tail sheath [Pseudoalteromonas phage C5a]|uniref:Tail sheath protein n=1 Tax=Pseudoalteromonas phage C5a TaxID=1916107 RepID=A0A1L5C2B3_9CAUD|nr:tail sheath [Pseudoalteromonas phage C5a]APM00243.1 tail sheath protein [Pseudoalteromonas phage C5a]